MTNIKYAFRISFYHDITLFDPTINFNVTTLDLTLSIDIFVIYENKRLDFFY